MEILRTVSGLKKALQPFRDEGKMHGFVPTMGALHEGHAELIRRCVEENDICTVSLFVNPTQFNNKEDLKLYPRTPEKDFELLEKLGVDFVFSPSVEEMYPEPDNRVFNFGRLDKVMEGAFREGHFNGVAQVVSKLFDYVEPERAYFGEKDYQQLAIVKDMVKQLQMNVEVVPVATVREQNGLAMSSRNQRLTETQRRNAAKIYEYLKESKSLSGTKSPSEVVDFVKERINNVEELNVEYFDIVDGDSLESISSWHISKSIVGCIAVFCGDVRLIDNIRYK